MMMCLLAGTAAEANGVYNVRDYGAKGDGQTLDSPAINAAIEAAVKAGGGQVLLPAGTYLSGSIRLKSNIDLHLSAGCTLLAAPGSMKAYDKSESFGGFPKYQDGGHTYFHNSLIWADDEKNISITGTWVCVQSSFGWYMLVTWGSEICMTAYWSHSSKASN